MKLFSRNFLLLLAVSAGAGILFVSLNFFRGATDAGDTRDGANPLVRDLTPVSQDARRAPELNATAFYLVAIDAKGNEKVLASKNEDDFMPIASITKLVTALSVYAFYDPLEEIRIDPAVLGGKGDSGRFRGGEAYEVNELMRAMLIESNNDAAEAFARAAGEAAFVSEMNRRAEALGLLHTHFVNPTGLDGAESNQSSARDAARILKEIVTSYPDVRAVLAMPEAEICTVGRIACFVATTTNALLHDPGFPMTIIGGKTGETPAAKKNLVLAARAPTPGLIIIGAVLGSDDHFRDMKKLLEWAERAYAWP